MIEIKNVKGMFGSQGFLLGIGVAAISHILAPQLKKTLRFTAVKGTQGVMALGNKTKQFLDDGKDNITTLFTETKVDFKDNIRDFTQDNVISSKVLMELKEEREASAKIMNELKDSILALKEEISIIKQESKPQDAKAHDAKAQESKPPDNKPQDNKPPDNKPQKT